MRHVFCTTKQTTTQEIVSFLYFSQVAPVAPTYVRFGELALCATLGAPPSAPPPLGTGAVLTLTPRTNKTTLVKVKLKPRGSLGVALSAKQTTADPWRIPPPDHPNANWANPRSESRVCDSTIQYSL